ncbi:MAG: SAM-dependent methyltransferase, partial [Gorillibacterium sp.]|nr:SAM-dependent methyltransferase [Gorillibacterium sp.]
FILAQELLDAFPVHRIRQKDGELLEIFVSWDNMRGHFQEVTRPCTHEAVLAYLYRESIELQEGQTAEINLHADAWIMKRISQIETGCLLAIDYGDRAEEIYAPHRMDGTLMCYYRHRAHDDPFFLPGQQDLTTHVNFSACIRAGEQAGAEKSILWSQKDFLLEHGVLNLLSSHSDPDPFSPIARKNRAIRQLLVGDRMGDLFKVLLHCKGIQALPDPK